MRRQELEQQLHVWNGDDNDVEELVARLGSNRGPGEVEGKEHYEINTQTGEYTEYAEFVLH